MESVHTYRAPIALAGTLSALVTVPTGFDPARESLPVILFLHGAGERGDGSDEQIRRLCVHSLPQLFDRDPDYKGLRVITVSPQCPESMIWDHLTLPLMDWLDVFLDRYHADRKRVSVTGLSMGGFGTWSLLTAFPDRFFRAAPVCGGGISWLCPVLAGKQIRVYHGFDDTVVPFRYAQIMTEAARGAGADITLYGYDRVGHGVFIPVYETTDVIEWLADRTS